MGEIMETFLEISFYTTYILVNTIVILILYSHNAMCTIYLCNVAAVVVIFNIHM